VNTISPFNLAVIVKVFHQIFER